MVNKESPEDSDEDRAKKLERERLEKIRLLETSESIPTLIELLIPALSPWGGSLANLSQEQMEIPSADVVAYKFESLKPAQKRNWGLAINGLLESAMYATLREDDKHGNGTRMELHALISKIKPSEAFDRVCEYIDSQEFMKYPPSHGRLLANLVDYQGQMPVKDRRSVDFWLKQFENGQKYPCVIWGGMLEKEPTDAFDNLAKIVVEDTKRVAYNLDHATPWAARLLWKMQDERRLHQDNEAEAAVNLREGYRIFCEHLIRIKKSMGEFPFVYARLMWHANTGSGMEIPAPEFCDFYPK